MPYSTGRGLYPTYKVYMISRNDLHYKHDYLCGRWVKPELAQTYATKGAAVRQARKLGNCSVVECGLTMHDVVEDCHAE